MGQEECFRNEYTSTNDYNMGFDLIAKNNGQRMGVLQNLLEEEEDKLKLFGNNLVTKQQLVDHLPENHCFKAQIHDENQQQMYEWVCHQDLKTFWDDKCLLGACDEGVEALHKLFLGECVELADTKVCPGEVHDISKLHQSDLAEHERIMGDRIWGLGHIGRAFRGSRCMKIANTFICDDDMLEILKTGCHNIHAHDNDGHHSFNVCDAQLADLLEGHAITLPEGKILKAQYSSDFTDLGDQCIQSQPNHYICWDDIDQHYPDDEECALYGETWLCYLQIRHAWQRGECVSIDGHEVCDQDFLKVAQRQCVDLDHVNYCPRAYGVKDFNPAKFTHETIPHPDVAHYLQ